MPDLNKTIETLKWIQFEIEINKHEAPSVGRFLPGIRDAIELLALLEEKEPHVMTLNELRAAEIGKPVYIEEISGFHGYDVFDGIHCGWVDFMAYTSDGGSAFPDETYGIEWRIWNTEPTEEQRKAEKWDEVLGSM